MSFFSSELGVAIAWICTVFSLLFGIFKGIENRNLKIEIKKYENNTQFNDQSQDTVTLNGEKNVYTKSNTGGIKIEM